MKLRLCLVYIKFFAKIITEPLLVYRYFYEQFRNFSFFAINKSYQGWQGSNLQPSDPKPEALSIRPHPLVRMGVRHAIFIDIFCIAITVAILLFYLKMKPLIYACQNLLVAILRYGIYIWLKASRWLL